MYHKAQFLVLVHLLLRRNEELKLLELIILVSCLIFLKEEKLLVRVIV